jgi:hypothetical protein
LDARRLAAGAPIAVEDTGTFLFYTEARIVELTGLRATNLEQMLALLRKVPGSSIFYHTHHMYLAHHFETPVFTNDFSRWVSECLHERALGEKLAAIDLLSFTSIRELRNAIIARIEEHTPDSGGRGHECPPDEQFHFCRSKSFILPTGLVARNPMEFFDLLPRVTRASLFFHFFEARLRLGKRSNDFSEWLAAQGEEDLAKKIDSLDPYSMTLDQFKERVAELGRRRR